MSRRRSRVQPLPWDDLPQAQWEQVSWWWDEIPGYEPWTWHDWQDAWSDHTLSVVWNVWRKEGSRIYAVHRDALLKEDLQSWLTMRAQEAATGFTPDPSHPAPDRQWMAYLYRGLREDARWHFGKVIGRTESAREAWNAGIVSTEHLDELEAEVGRVIGRHALHGHPFGTEDPASIIIRLENLQTQLADIERRAGEGTFTTTSEYCLINLCTRLAEVRGLCDKHWRAERALEKNLDLPCNVPDCTNIHNSRGLCVAHLDRWRRGTLPADLHQYVETERRKPGPKPSTEPKPPCSIDGCQKPSLARERCRKHYRQLTLAEAPPCSEPECDKPAYVRGMCTRCYQRWNKARRTGEISA